MATLDNNMEQIEVLGKLYYDNENICEDIKNIDKDTNTDVILQADNIKIPAHRDILSSASQYFASMFHSGFKEKDQNEITINGVSGQVLQEILTFIYQRKIFLHKNNTLDILSAASLLQCDRLEKVCCQILDENVHNSNCLQIIYLANKYSYSDLRRKSIEYASKNFERIPDKRQFLDLTYEDLSEILSNTSNVPRQECVVEYVYPKQEYVLEVVSSWLHSDLESRGKYSMDLLKLVKLQLLPNKYLLHRASKLFNYNPKCLELLVDALSMRDSMEFFEMMYLNANNLSPSIWVMSHHEENVTVTNYNPLTDTWTTTKVTNKKYKDFSVYDADFFHNKLLKVNCGDLEIFDLKRNTYQKVGFLIPRYNPTLALVKRNTDGQDDEDDDDDYDIYVISGRNFNGTPLNIVERWNSRSKLWKTMAPIVKPVISSACKAVVIDNKIYVVDMIYRGKKLLCELKVYVPQTNFWKMCQSLTIPIKEFDMQASNVVSHGKYIYILDGSTNFVWRNNTEEDTWFKCASMCHQRHNTISCIFQNKLYAIGGNDDKKKYLDTVEEYDEEQDTWKLWKSMSAKMKYPYTYVYPVF